MRTIRQKNLEEFKAHLILEEKSENTVEKYVRDVTFFKAWLSGREVTKLLLLEYKKELCENYAPRSVNAAISSLNCFFGFMEWHDLRLKALKLQRQIFVGEEKELTKPEYQRLLSAAQGNRRLYFLMQTICSTGIRVSELRFITTDAIKRGQAQINCKGKMRVVFLPAKLCGMLKTYANEEKIKNGPIFVTKNGKPLDRSNIWKQLKALCETAGIEKGKVFPHNLRHLFARTFYSVEKDIVRLADVLGHASVNTTRIYTMETGAVHRRQIQKLGLLQC